MFADVLEQTLQAEMDQHLGYDRAERTSCDGKKNYRNVKRTMNDDSLRKMLYLAIQNLSNKWTQRYRNWDLIQNQLSIMDAVKA